MATEKPFRLGKTRAHQRNRANNWRRSTIDSPPPVNPSDWGSDCTVTMSPDGDIMVMCACTGLLLPGTHTLDDWDGRIEGHAISWMGAEVYTTGTNQVTIWHGQVGSPDAGANFLSYTEGTIKGIDGTPLPSKTWDAAHMSVSIPPVPSMDNGWGFLHTVAPQWAGLTFGPETLKLAPGPFEMGSASNQSVVGGIPRNSYEMDNVTVTREGDREIRIHLKNPNSSILSPQFSLNDAPPWTTPVRDILGREMLYGTLVPPEWEWETPIPPSP